MDSDEIRKDITDRGIEKAQAGMDEALEPISRRNAEIRANARNENLSVHNSGQMAPDASDQTGTTPFGGPAAQNFPERAGIGQRKTAAEHRAVNSEAARESFKEAELDPIAETEPEEGEKAA